MDKIEWLSNPEHVGIFILIAILQIAFTVVQYRVSDTSELSSIPVRIAQGIILLVVGWVIYSILWSLLAFSMGFPPAGVLHPLYFVLSAFTVIGAIITKSPRVGGFIGGSLPLATLSLFYLSSNPQMQASASPLAWFGVFMIFGGLMGTLTGPAAIRIIQAIKLQMFIFGKSKIKKPQDDHFSTSFDAFLSYNSKDKIAVRQLAQVLQARGLRVWLDEEQLIPGRSWQEELEKIIQTTRTAVVLVGKDGFGPWQIPEMRTCLSQLHQRNMPVIPVLLPDAPTKPELPPFLNQVTWVDLRGGFTKENLSRLEWGITGTKFRQSQLVK